MSDVRLNTFKCPKCGADIKFNRGDEYATCEFCGTMVQVPKREITNKQLIMYGIMAVLLLGFMLFDLLIIALT